ncbi:hypothetical protein BN6_56120 [Saccharothrix espanaensis DSM 44229]|uniref:Uncharacterized protein n=1 Tax=Saccharothrix espanaensis (strain ATCC 51144 / DSM 44229 / JCM 9112 / NBRC 15066 / NRRL 15764) TaxID=1179773 RepID=K0K3G8_SACES|nr:hypothetical protein BN6_56120 [Saccharothrix espanaensis DSM 44229]
MSWLPAECPAHCQDHEDENDEQCEYGDRLSAHASSRIGGRRVWRHVSSSLLRVGVRPDLFIAEF